MKKELNIAAILKDKPKGTKLWSPIVGSCTFKGISSKNSAIVASFFDKDREQLDWDFNEYGKTLSAPKEAEVCLFPSKQMQDWSKFAWKKGDVLTDNISTICMFDSWANEDYTEFNAKYTLHLIASTNAENEVCKTNDFVPVLKDDDKQSYLATAETYFNVNLTKGSLEIEHPKQPEFKDGDIVAFDKSVAICRHISEYTIYFYACISKTWGLMINDNSVSGSYRLATDSEKQQLFDALAKKGKKWNPDTLQLEDLPKKCEFNAFDKVLVRVGERAKWNMALFIEESKYECDRLCPYRVFNIEEISNKSYGQCIPYNEETKHLLGTTDEWKGGE